MHLGSDILDGAANKARRSQAIDRDLVELLAHYRTQPPRGARWRIVIAGDFIDFIGMTIPSVPSPGLETPPTEEELEHGLGNAADHARLKLKRVAERHADVFGALASFVADGHALSLVHGNHDIEFYWDGVQDDFRQILLRLALETSGEELPLDRAAFLARIEFNPWFFYRDGVAYIEHGHQYDPFCATDTVMTPLSPLDPRRVARGFSDTLLRFVVRRTNGMKEHGHESVGIVHYVTFGLRLGLTGMFRLAQCFASAVVELFRLRRVYVSDAARALRHEHEQRVAKLAEATRIGKDRLRALLSLQVPPITSSIRGILASVLLDRLALALLATLSLTVLGIVSAFRGHFVWGAAGVLLAWSLLHRYLASQRVIDPADVLVERATQLARLFPAAFVVMGHTHVPVAVPAGQATYVNVGSWAEDDESSLPAARTHLVIRVGEDGAEAQFCSWDSGAPKPMALPALVPSVEEGEG
ncbi:hypothetical protein [Labilithrix luteola]|uniref:hypothetical protein n=1 Tax=Labilithrix luteola TaxID=1391654 RepID=UPI0011BAD045|nr:hypothetical protein [Labilithrix luteola]